MASVLLKLLSPPWDATGSSPAACWEGGLIPFSGALKIPGCSILMDEADRRGPDGDHVPAAVSLSNRNRQGVADG
ncbi:MAG: hypothetical protein WC934_07135 [Acidithiobacillus sp.]